MVLQRTDRGQAVDALISPEAADQEPVSRRTPAALRDSFVAAPPTAAAERVSSSHQCESRLRHGTALLGKRDWSDGLYGNGWPALGH